ncbi:MAG: hypothetical protein WCI45_00160 [Desulfuromonadales bacterium]
MSAMIQSMIADANRRVKASNSRAFGKKATDQKVHEHLFRCVEIYIDSFRKDPASNNTRAAFQEMSQATTLSRRNLKP